MRRGPTIALIMLLALSSYDFSARPQRLIESFRALRCCTEHCQRAGNMSSSARCCGVVQDEAALRAVDNTSPDFDSVTAVALPGAMLVTKGRPAADVAFVNRAEPSRSPPLFLSKLSLLL